MMMVINLHRSDIDQDSRDACSLGKSTDAKRVRCVTFNPGRVFQRTHCNGWKNNDIVHTGIFFPADCKQRSCTDIEEPDDIAK